MTILMDGNLHTLKSKLEENFSGFKEEQIDLEYLFNSDNRYPDFNLTLVKQYISKIMELTGNYNINFTINYILKGNYIVDTNKCKDLEEIDNYLRDNYGKELKIYPKSNSFHRYGFRETLNANRKLDKIANEIKNITNDGKPLSPYERFMIAYEYVSNYVYNEGGDLMHTTTSHWIPVVEGDKIVCAGYASLLQALCDRIFTENEVKVFTQTVYLYDKKDMREIGGHGNNIVIIKDDKYGINGMFYADACWDCISDKRKDKPQAFCCIPIRDILHNKNRAFVFAKGFTNLYLSQFDEYRQLVNSLLTIQEEQEDQNDVLANIASKGKTFADVVEEFFTGYLPDTKERDYYNDFIDENIIYYDKWQYLTNEDQAFLEQEREEISSKVSKTFKKVLDKYKTLEIPSYFAPQLIEHYNLQPHIDNLCEGCGDDRKIEKSIKYIGNCLSEPRAQEFRKKCEEVGVESIDFHKFVVGYVSDSRYNSLVEMVKEKKKEMDSKSKAKNAAMVKENLNNLANCAPIPFKAFVEAYKIIGRLKGLEGKELREYVKQRITKSIERTNKSFEIDQCDNCFAIGDMEKLKKC